MKTLSPEKRVDRLNKINSAFAKSREFGDDKVQLAMQTYEMVSSPLVTKQASDRSYIFQNLVFSFIWILKNHYQMV